MDSDQKNSQGSLPSEAETEQNPSQQQAKGELVQPAAESGSYSAFRGPLPPPDVLAGYEDVEPGLGKAIAAAFFNRQAAIEEQSKTEQRILEKTADARIADVKRSHWMAFAAAAMAFAVVVLALFLGSDDVAKTIGSVTVLGLVGAFISGRVRDWRRSRSELEEEDEED